MHLLDRFSSRLIVGASGGLLFIASCAAYAWLSYAAGCAGDMKGGVAGNPARALELEGLSSVPLLFALAIIAGAPFMFLRASLARRICIAVVSCVTLGIVLIVVGMDIELGASQQCFAK